MINDHTTPPSDAELIQFATDEQFLLFCDEDEFVDIAHVGAAAAAKYRDAQGSAF